MGCRNANTLRTQHQKDAQDAPGMYAQKMDEIWKTLQETFKSASSPYPS